MERLRNFGGGIGTGAEGLTGSSRARLALRFLSFGIDKGGGGSEIGAGAETTAGTGAGAGAGAGGDGDDGDGDDAGGWELPAIVVGNTTFGKAQGCTASLACTRSTALNNIVILSEWLKSGDGTVRTGPLVAMVEAKGKIKEQRKKLVPRFGR